MINDIKNRPMEIGDQFHIDLYEGLCTIIEIGDTGHLGALISAKCFNDKFSECEYKKFYEDLVKPFKVRTWAELAELALNIRSELDLHNVINEFSNVIDEVTFRLRHERKGGMIEVNTHPVCIVFAAKIAGLAYAYSDAVWSNAYQELLRLKDSE